MNEPSTFGDEGTHNQFHPEILPRSHLRHVLHPTDTREQRLIWHKAPNKGSGPRSLEGSAKDHTGGCGPTSQLSHSCTVTDPSDL
jgi:hypothetical protein